MDVVEHNDVVQAVAPKRADESLRVRVLPRGTRRRDDFLDAQGSRRPPLVRIRTATCWRNSSSRTRSWCCVRSGAPAAGSGSVGKTRAAPPQDFGVRTRDALDVAIRRGMDLIGADDARAWFTHCGYQAHGI